MFYKNEQQKILNIFQKIVDKKASEIVTFYKGEYKNILRRFFLMKKTSNFFIALLMAITLFFAGLSSFNGTTNQASALPQNYEPQANSIYYFYDYYPTLGYSTLYDMFGDYPVYYDYKDVNSGEFNDLVGKKPEESYFWGFHVNTLVIIDIKNFLPNPDSLYNLFSYLVFQNCKLIVVSGYNEYTYPYTMLQGSGVVFIEDHGDALENLSSRLVDNLSKINFSISNFRILLDNNLAGIDEHYDGNIKQLYRDSFAVHCLLTALTGLDELEDVFDVFIDILSNNRNIQILVHITDNEFIDILTNHWYTIDSYRDLQYEIRENEYETYPAAAMGFLRLDPDFYDLLSAFQNEDPGFPVYAIERDPIEFSDYGLSVILGGGGDNSAASDLLDAIGAFING